MFQFNYKLKVSERVKAKCDRHPRYNPEREGRGGIKGGCSTCFSLFDLYQARLSLDAAHREFLRRAGVALDAEFLCPATESRSVEAGRTTFRCKVQASEPKGCVYSSSPSAKNTAMMSKNAPLISLRR